MARVRKGKLITVEVDEALYRHIKGISKRTGVSISFKIREALEAWSDSAIHDKMADVQERSYGPPIPTA